MCPSLSFVGDCRPGCSTPGEVTGGQSRGKESPPFGCWPHYLWCSPGYSCLCGLWGCIAGFCWAFPQPTSSIHSPPGCSQSILYPTQPEFVFGVVATQVQNLHLAWLNFMKFPWACLSSLSVSLWMTSLSCSVLCAPHSLVLLPNLLRTHSIHCPCCQQRC